MYIIIYMYIIILLLSILIDINKYIMDNRRLKLIFNLRFLGII
jgi:hypothetical protein